MAFSTQLYFFPSCGALQLWVMGWFPRLTQPVGSRGPPSRANPGWATIQERFQLMLMLNGVGHVLASLLYAPMADRFGRRGPMPSFSCCWWLVVEDSQCLACWYLPIMGFTMSWDYLQQTILAMPRITDWVSYHADLLLDNNCPGPMLL